MRAAQVHLGQGLNRSPAMAGAAGTSSFFSFFHLTNALSVLSGPYLLVAALRALRVRLDRRWVSGVEVASAVKRTRAVSVWCVLVGGDW